MSDNSKYQMRTGIIGSVVAALCCFTPLLVILLGAVGLSAWLGWIDYVLFPVLFASLGIMAHAFYIRAGRTGPKPKIIIVIAVTVLSGLIIWLEFKYAIRITIAAAATVAVYAYYLRARELKQTSAPC